MRSFKSELAVGNKYQIIVQARLEGAGIKCVPGPTGKGSTPDLWANGVALEVKSSRRKFTGDREGYPYPTVDIDTVACWDAKFPKPHAYVFVCQSTGCILWLPGWTACNWSKVERPDNIRKIKNLCYVYNSRNLRRFAALLDALGAPATAHTEGHL
jgi:hypothetical protein